MRLTTSKNYLLVLLTIIMVFNYIDRIAMGLMLEDIKRDLVLTDTQLGFLTGIAFAFFYSLMGLPIARWADRGNRVTIISLTVALWSGAVALCGAAGTYAQMLAVRIGVAVGEAGCHPPAFSLIADYFERSERPRAVARYMLGWPLALLLGFFAAGWLNETYGWRMTFVILGAPGILLAILAMTTIREPRRTGPQPMSSTASAAQPSVQQVLRTLWGNLAYRHLLVCFALSYFFGNGILQWQPAFFVRSYGLDTQEIGVWFAIIYGLGGLFGTYLGGELAARYAAENERLQLVGMAVMYAVWAILGAGVYLAPHKASALTFLTLAAIGNAAIAGPLFAATQTLVPAHMRAMSIAIIMFCANLIGLGLGPLAVGALSDALRVWFAEESLRYALLIMCPGYFWCAWQLWRASCHVRASQYRGDVDDEQFKEATATR